MLVGAGVLVTPASVHQSASTLPKRSPNCWIQGRGRGKSRQQLQHEDNTLDHLQLLYNSRILHNLRDWNSSHDATCFSSNGQLLEADSYDLGPGDKHEQGISIRLTMGLRPFNQNMQGTSPRHVIGYFYNASMFLTFQS